MKRAILRSTLKRLAEYHIPAVAFATVFIAFIVYSKIMNRICDVPIEETIVPDAVEEVSYLTDENLSELYSYKPEINETSEGIVEIDYEDAQLLMHIARAEAGTSLDGQLWTMRTLINRIESDEFPDEIWDVVSQKGQFEVYANGRYKTVELNENSHLALAMIEGGWDETDGAIWFEASTNSPNSWHATHLTFIKEVEGQRYYK